MASSGSLKDLSKAINAYYSGPSTLPIPEELDRAIEAYLEKHEKFDDATSEKLHEELQEIYRKHVEGHPEKCLSFIGIFRRLLCVLRVPERIFHWWDVLRLPVIDNAREKGFLIEFSAAVLDMTMLDDGDSDESSADPQVNPFAERLFTSWMERDHAAASESDPGNEAMERLARETMIAWGKKKPKDFLAVIDKSFVKGEFRSRAARMLCDYIQNQPPHLHLILQTSLFGNLLRSLQLDTSTTVISLVTTIVIMVLPHIPNSLVPHLPTLFNIYARLLFWENERSGMIETLSEDAERKNSTSPAGWEACGFSPETDDVNVPHLGNYFTVLYGLYPLNFTDYIRKPQRYLRHANVADSDEVDVEPTEIRHRSERFRQSHLLHSNFYTLTIESEKTDMARWLNAEPAELVADCMALRVSSGSSAGGYNAGPPLPGAAASSLLSDGSDREALGAPLLSGSMPDRGLDSWRTAGGSAADSRASSQAQTALFRWASQSSRPSNKDCTESRSRDAGGDSPTLPPHVEVSAPPTQLPDSVQSDRATQSDLQRSPTQDSLRLAGLGLAEPNLGRPSGGAPSSGPADPSSDLHADAQPVPIPAARGEEIGLDSQSTLEPSTALLRQHIMLLQNDLNFERYLKQQHMAHIGELRRKQMQEAASEAETQHLIMANRNLKNRLEDAKMAEMQIRKESEMSRTLAKKWESDLSAKLRTMREDFKRTKAEEESVNRELLNAKSECEKLRKIVCDAEVRELNARQKTQSIEVDAAEIQRLMAEVDRLTVSERDLQARELERQTALNSAVEAENRAEILDLKLTARDRELQKTKRLFQAQIATLNAKLTEAQDGGRQTKRQQDEGGGNGGGNEAVEGALAAGRSKQVELQKQYAALMRKYMALQAQLEDSKFTASSAADPLGSKPELGVRAEGEDWSLHSISPVTSRSRGHRVLSDTDSLDPTSYNMTPPLESRASTPTIPPASSVSSPVAEGPSSEGRFYGRGGSGNKIRKDDKGKKKDEGEKKEKKPMGIRGIRGFV